MPVAHCTWRKTWQIANCSYLSVQSYQYFSCIESLACLVMDISGRRLALTEGAFCVQLFTLLNPGPPVPPSPQHHQLLLWHVLYSFPGCGYLSPSHCPCRSLVLLAKKWTPKLVIKHHDPIFDAFSSCPGSVCTAAHRVLGAGILPQLFLN